MGKFLKIALFVIPAVIVVGAGIYLFQQYKKSTTVEKIIGKTIPELAPWSVPASTTSAPPSPTAATLDSKYRAIQAAIASRDYEAFKLLISSERVWHTENPKKLVGESPDGEPVNERILGLNAIDNFEKNAPYAYSFNAPKYEDLAPGVVFTRASQPRRNLILINPETNEKEKLIVSSWPYQYEIRYDFRAGYPDSGFGGVIFVWDNGDWKYNGEYWNITPHTTPLNIGEGIGSAQTVTFDKSGACVPQVVTISAGDSVGWENIQGRIYSIPPSVDHWDSGYLYSDNYYKSFSKPGEYAYLIQRPPNEPEKAKTCTIKVQ